MKEKEMNTEKVENTEKAEKVENTEKVEKIDSSDHPESTDNSDRSESSEKSDRPENSDQPESSENSESPEKSDQPVPVCSSQAAAAPLPPPSENPSEVPTLAVLATKACQSLSEMVDAEDTEAITHLLTSLVKDLEKGELGKKSIKALLQSLHYERDITTASQKGEIKGRNAKIEELMAERERTSNIHMPTGARNNLLTPPPPHVIGGLAAADRRTIWERGNEKRTVY